MVEHDKFTLDRRIKHGLHVIEVRKSSFVCSCGVRGGTFLGRHAFNLANKHVLAVIPFRIKFLDCRDCSTICEHTGTYGERPFGEHHEECKQVNKEMVNG